MHRNVEQGIDGTQRLPEKQDEKVEPNNLRLGATVQLKVDARDNFGEVHPKGSKGRVVAFTGTKVQVEFPNPCVFKRGRAVLNRLLVTLALIFAIVVPCNGGGWVVTGTLMGDIPAGFGIEAVCYDSDMLEVYTSGGPDDNPYVGVKVESFDLPANVVVKYIIVDATVSNALFLTENFVYSYTIDYKEVENENFRATITTTTYFSTPSIIPDVNLVERWLGSQGILH